MPTCRICLRTFKSLKFKTEHINICTRCVNTLNESPEPAKNAEARLAEMLTRGMQRNAERDLKSDDEWKRRKAQLTLDDLHTAVARKLHNWITRLLSAPNNSMRDFKIMRAYRRELLRKEGFADRLSEDAWKKVAQRIRRRDGFKCMECGATNTTLDVHHIIYLSHHGTNQQSNLITLCRKCHEAEHDRAFSFADSQDPGSASPVPPKHSGIDPELMIDGMTIAAAYIESGVRSFSDYAKAMIEDLGGGVRPYLLSLWEAVRNHPGLNTKGMTDPAVSAHLHQALLASAKREMVLPQSRALSASIPTATSSGLGAGCDTKSASLNEARNYPNVVVDARCVHSFGLQNDSNHRLSQLSGNIDPELLALTIELAVFHIEAGAWKFSELAKVMIDDLGDAVTPFLRSAYEGARWWPGLNTEGMSPNAEQSAVERNHGQRYMYIGHTTLFGGNGRPSSRLAFNEETYALAKPHLQAMLIDTQAAGKDLTDFICSVLTNYGTSVNPYITRFANHHCDEQASKGGSNEHATLRSNGPPALGGVAAEEGDQSRRKEARTMKRIRHLSEYRIARELGEALKSRLINACIRELQRTDYALLFGEFSGLRNTWDEVCVQQQRELSFSWRAYQATIEASIEGRLEDLQPFELDALWLLTREGDDWDCELEGERETYPVMRDHVLVYLQDEVLTQALNWSNERISRYLERQYEVD